MTRHRFRESKAQHIHVPALPLTYLLVVVMLQVNKSYLAPFSSRVVLSPFTCYLSHDPGAWFKCRSALWISSAAITLLSQDFISFQLWSVPTLCRIHFVSHPSQVPHGQNLEQIETARSDWQVQTAKKKCNISAPTWGPPLTPTIKSLTFKAL